MAKALNDAEHLLKYAAEVGIKTEDEDRDGILRARTACAVGWDEKSAAALLSALTRLAAEVKPVTAESLRATLAESATRNAFRKYRNISVIFAVCILFFSLATFITTAISNTIRAQIATANDLSAKLRAQLGTPSEASIKDPSKSPQGISQVEIITELQLYASTIRDIDARAEQLDWFLAGSATEYYLESLKTNAAASHRQFQLDVGLADLWEAEKGRTLTFQHVRTFAQNVLDDVSVIFGAIGTCFLPVLYAVFGACAFLLRNYEREMSARTFIPSPADSARFLIAGICGAVVGLFNITISQGASVPPLAVAFLVGYGVDVFFAFLEGLLQMFNKKGVSP